MKARKLPIFGIIIIIKCLIVRKFNYVALIIRPSEKQIKTSQNMINAFIREGDHHWISEKKCLHKPIKEDSIVLRF